MKLESLKERSHGIKGFFGIRFAAFYERFGDLRLKAQLVESLSFVRLVDVVTPIDVRMGPLHRLDHISSNVNVLQLVLPGDIGKSIHLWVFKLFQVVWRGALDNINGDEAVVVSGDLPTSIDGGLYVCIVGSHSVHEEVELERSLWENTWH